MSTARSVLRAVGSLWFAAALLVLWLVYPLVKGLHELGHAFATRMWGGEVHEIGVLFLVFIPIPYVEASAASAFPDKRKRIVVGAAGMGRAGGGARRARSGPRRS